MSNCIVNECSDQLVEKIHIIPIKSHFLLHYKRINIMPIHKRGNKEVVELQTSITYECGYQNL